MVDIYEATTEMALVSKIQFLKPHRVTGSPKRVLRK